MASEARGKHLFIVDNSDSGWTGLRYLEEWTAIARAFDIATGFFEISALLALDGKWQQLEKIRILMGGETTKNMRHTVTTPSFLLPPVYGPSTGLATYNRTEGASQ